MKYGLLGRKLSHSFSPQIHNLLGNYPYELLEREPEEIGELFQQSDLAGFNVTIPYKKEVMAYCDRISEIATRIGCVNTVVRERDGTWFGTNTDYDGFQRMLHSLVPDLTGKRVVILGKGATSLTVHAVCEDEGAVSIQKLGRQELAQLYTDSVPADILINCTPVGMYPNTLESPVRLGDFPNVKAVFDVVYNPHRTALLLKARKKGIPYADGLTMLVGQAIRASEYFTGIEYPIEKTEEIRSLLRSETENVVLIGMPGCGKTSLGKKVAEMMNKRFVDLDAAIEVTVGMSIPEFFAAHGEEAFRMVETQTAGKYGKESGQVISAGGGVIKRAENYDLLAQNGTICYIQRKTEELPIQGRPLSAGGPETLHRLFAEREPLYLQFADYTVENIQFSKAVTDIVEGFYAHCGN